MTAPDRPGPPTLSRLAQFELIFRPNFQLVPVVRVFISEFYQQMLDADSVSRVAMATHELLENAVKYSADGSTELSITVDHEDAASRVLIRLSNKARPEDISTLNSFFEEMHGAPDPFEHYQLAMRRSARRKHGSGLGLVRVRAEGEMSMSHTVDSDTVCILAETHVQRSQP